MNSHRILPDFRQGMSYQKLTSSLENLASELTNVWQRNDANEIKIYIPVSLKLAEGRFVNHICKYVQVLVACCIASLLKLFHPHPPYKNSFQLKMVFQFLINQLEGLKRPYDPAFERYTQLFMILDRLRPFRFPSNLSPGDKDEIICSLFGMIFEVVSDRTPPELQSRMLDLLCHFLNEENVVSPNLLKIILRNIEHPLKSKPFIYNFSREIIKRSWQSLNYGVLKLASSLINVIENTVITIPTRLVDLINELNSILYPNRINTTFLVVSMDGGNLETINHEWARFIEQEVLRAENTAREKSSQSNRCNKCGRQFHTGGNLNRHRLIHSGKRPFPCNLCSLSFSQKVHLQRHIQMLHLRGKQYTCALCERQFYQKSDLNRHLQLHSGEKPFQCNVCGKNFALNSTLNGHKKTHDLFKPHRCHVCGKSFREIKILKGHLKIHIRQVSN